MWISGCCVCMILCKKLLTYFRREKSEKLQSGKIINLDSHQYSREIAHLDASTPKLFVLYCLMSFGPLHMMKGFTRRFAGMCLVFSRSSLHVKIAIVSSQKTPNAFAKAGD